jgi:hypothetical protein
VSCLSENANDCVWGNCNERLAYYSDPANAARIKPLVCGSMHQAAYGEPGYGDPEHWCYKGNNLIPR